MNNREIKFRAYVKDEGRYRDNKMYSWEDILDSMDEEFNPRKNLFGLGLNYENVVLMQYTGLKDKNGKEIYEGDILNDKTVVVFYGLFAYFGFAHYDINAKPAWVYAHSFKPELVEKLEVIGNIYENKELLND